MSMMSCNSLYWIRFYFILEFHIQKAAKPLRFVEEFNNMGQNFAKCQLST